MQLYSYCSSYSPCEFSDSRFLTLHYKFKNSPTSQDTLLEPTPVCQLLFQSILQEGAEEPTVDKHRHHTLCPLPLSVHISNM